MLVCDRPYVQVRVCACVYLFTKNKHNLCCYGNINITVHPFRNENVKHGSIKRETFARARTHMAVVSNSNGTSDCVSCCLCVLILREKLCRSNLNRTQATVA